MVLVACGPSNEELLKLTDERIAAALTAVPTSTPAPPDPFRALVAFAPELESSLFLVDGGLNTAVIGWLVGEGLIVA